MILVDSSVWIDYFHGTPTPEADKLDTLLGRQPLVTGDLVLAEVLQGFSLDRDFNQAKKLLTSLTVIDLRKPGTDHGFETLLPPSRISRSRR